MWALPFTVNVSQASSDSIIDSSATVGIDSIAAGQAMTVSATVTSFETISNALLDIEIRSGWKFAQHVVHHDLVAGQPVTIEWQTTAPTQAAWYQVKIGVFSEGWGTLYHWNDQAAVFEVTNTTTVPILMSTNAEIASANVAAGEAITIIAVVRANQAVANTLVDIELYGPHGRAGQHTAVVNLEADQDRSVVWNLPAPSLPGPYRVKVGAFTSNWSMLHAWNDSAAQFTVLANASAPLNIVAGARLAQATVQANGTINFIGDVTASHAVDALLDVELYNASGSKVGQFFSPIHLGDNQTVSTNGTITAPAAAGDYMLKVGVFSPDWGTLYVWNNDAANLTVSP
jgi:hypothetical protein